VTALIGDWPKRPSSGSRAGETSTDESSPRRPRSAQRANSAPYLEYQDSGKFEETNEPRRHPRDQLWTLTFDHCSLVCALTWPTNLAASGSRELALADRRELARQLALTRLRDMAAERVALGQTPIEPIEEQRLAHAVLDALFGLGRLQELVGRCRDREHRRQWMRSSMGHLRERPEGPRGAHCRLGRRAGGNPSLCRRPVRTLRATL